MGHKQLPVLLPPHAIGKSERALPGLWGLAWSGGAQLGSCGAVWPHHATQALTRCQQPADFARVLAHPAPSVIGDLLIGTWGAGLGLGVHAVGR